MGGVNSNIRERFKEPTALRARHHGGRGYMEGCILSLPNARVQVAGVAVLSDRRFRGYLLYARSATPGLSTNLGSLLCSVQL